MSAFTNNSTPCNFAGTKSPSNGRVFEEKAILSNFRHLWVTFIEKSKKFQLFAYITFYDFSLHLFFGSNRSKIDRVEKFTHLEHFLMTFQFGSDGSGMSPKIASNVIVFEEKAILSDFCEFCKLKMGLRFVFVTSPMIPKFF